MKRTLRAGPRPFVALGTIFGLLLMMLLVGRLRGTMTMGEFAKPALFVAALFGAIGWNIWQTRILVDEDRIAFIPAIGFRKEVLFADIKRSVSLSLAEPEHPLSLSIYGADDRLPMLEFGLKPYRRGDVTWLLGLKELRVLNGV